MNEDQDPAPAETAPIASPGGLDEGSTPRPEVIPRPTYAPAALAFGITLLFWGLITSPVVLAMGFLVFTVALVMWIGEMRHDQEEA